MDVFSIREQMVEEYRSFTGAFVAPRDERITGFLKARLDAGAQWPDPWLSLNPNFAAGGSVTDLVDAGLLHHECDRIFRDKKHVEDRGTPLNFHQHQVDAFRAAATGKSYVLTTGTGREVARLHHPDRRPDPPQQREAEPVGGSRRSSSTQ